jgi:hypothetical protein
MSAEGSVIQGGNVWGFSSVPIMIEGCKRSAAAIDSQQGC